MPLHKIKLPDGCVREAYEWVRTEEQGGSFEDWVGTLTQENQQKLARLLRLCFSHVNFPLHTSKEKFRYEFDHKEITIWAIKCYQIRIYGFLSSGDFIILHYLLKKKDKLGSVKATIKKKIDAYWEEKNERSKKRNIHLSKNTRRNRSR